MPIKATRAYLLLILAAIPLVSIGDALHKSQRSFRSPISPVVGQEVPIPREETCIIEITAQMNVFNSFSHLVPNGVQWGSGYHQVVQEWDWYINYATGEVIYWRIKGWDYNDDYTSFTMHFREGVTWNDGMPHTARDKTFTLNLILENDGLLGHTFATEWIESVETIDDYNLVVQLKRPNPRFHHAFRMWGDLPQTVARHVWEGVDPTRFKNSPPVETGPYRLYGVYPDGPMFIWERRDDYWGRDLGCFPAPKYLTYCGFKDSVARTRALETGELDIPLPHTFAWEEVQLSRERVTIAPYLDPCPLGIKAFNCERYPMNITDLRVAVSCLIDREKLASIYPLAAETWSCAVPWPAWESLEEYRYPDVLGVYGYPDYDPAEAVGILDEYGFIDMDGDGLREMPNGTSLSIEIIGPPIGLVGEGSFIGLQLADELRMIGIDASYRGLSEKWFETVLLGRYHIIVGCISSDMWLSTDLFGLLDNFHSRWYFSGEARDTKGDFYPANRRYRSDELDEILASASRLPLSDPSTTDLYKQGLAIVMHDLPLVPAVERMFIQTFSTEFWEGWPAEGRLYQMPFSWWPTFLFVLAKIEPVKAPPPAELPDLVVTREDVTISPADPSRDEEVTVSAVVTNTGDEQAKEVLVVFEVDGSEFGREIIELLEPGGQQAVESTWVATTLGNHTLSVEIDPEGRIAEGDDRNNIAEEMIVVVGLPDLLLEDIVVSPTTPLPEEEVRIEAIVANVGDKQAREVQVLFMVDESEFARKTIELLEPDGRVAVEVTWVATTPGDHTLFVEIDFDGLIAELEEGNNSDEKTIRVVGLPDLLLEDIVVSHETCRVGEQVSIEVTVCNEGESSAEGVEVVFSCGDWEETKTIDIEPGGREVVEVTYTAVSSGRFPVTVVVDPDRLIPESNEGNNEASGVDLRVDPLIDPPLVILGSGVVGVSAFAAWSFFHPRPPPYEMERGLEQSLDEERNREKEDDEKREKKGHLVFFKVDEDPKRVVKSSSEATVRVRNVGTSPAKRVEVRASATQGIILEKSEVTVPEVKVRKTLRFPFNVDKAAKRGIYYLRFKVKSKDTPEQTKRRPLRAAKIGLLSQGGKPESIRKLGEWLAKHDYNYASLRSAESYLRLLRHDIVIAPPDIEMSPKGVRNLCSFAERGHSILVVGMIETEELEMIASALGYSGIQYAPFETSHGVLRITDSQHPITAGFGVGHEIDLGSMKGRALSSPVSTGKVLAELVVAEGERVAAIVANQHGNGKVVHLNFSAERHMERLDAILVEALNWLLLPVEADQ